jgi:hypothetical protein
MKLPSRPRLRRVRKVEQDLGLEDGTLLETPAGVVDRYGVALGLIAATIVVDFSLAAEAWGALLAVILGSGTLLFVLTTSEASPRVVRAVRIFVVIVIALALVGAVFRDTQMQGLIFLAGGALAMIAPLAIIRRLLAHKTITAHTVYGALCLYLLSGLFFAYLYAFVGVLAGPAFAQSASAGLPDTVYFSFVTLATVGYGDLTPGTQLMRMLAVGEAIGGQLYLVTAIALLVSNLGRERGRPVAVDGETATGADTATTGGTSRPVVDGGPSSPA